MKKLHQMPDAVKRFREIKIGTINGKVLINWNKLDGRQC